MDKFEGSHTEQGSKEYGRIVANINKTYKKRTAMEEHKLSISRSDAFRSMPLRHKTGGLDAKLISSLKEDSFLHCPTFRLVAGKIFVSLLFGVYDCGTKQIYHV
jgi:hypothetical protein